MKKNRFLVTICCVCMLLFSFCSKDDDGVIVTPPGNEEKPDENNGKDEEVDETSTLVILKLDDLMAASGAAVPEAWIQVTNFLEEKKIKAAYGIIGISLESNNQAYYDWIKNTAARGYIEFWNHGYQSRTTDEDPGEFEGDYESHLESLQKVTSLGKEKLGLTFIAWGPHWSSTNAYTDWALSQVPEIKLAFGYPLEEPYYYKGLVMPRNVNIEHPTHNPDFDNFMRDYERYKEEVDYFFLQGHPDSWYNNTERWDNFVRIVEFLDSQEDIRFVTPNELLDILDKRAALKNK